MADCHKLEFDSGSGGPGGSGCGFNSTLESIELSIDVALMFIGVLLLGWALRLSYRNGSLSVAIVCTFMVNNTKISFFNAFLLQFPPMVQSYVERGVYPLVGLWLCVGTASGIFAQGGPQPLVQGTIVTGHCQGHASEPGCVLPNLFGPGGLSLFNNPVFPHYAHFIGSAQTTLNQTLGTAIATQLAILPIVSPASGFTYKYDPSAGAFERSTTTFGPIYTERAETIGEGKFYFGISYQRFRFDKLDGII